MLLATMMLKLFTFAMIPALVSSSTCVGTSKDLIDHDCAMMQAWVDHPAYHDRVTSICPTVRSDPCNCTFDRPVDCDGGRVRQLRLGKQGLEGPFPEMLINLTGLVWFDMAANNITGTIPEAITQLTDLGFLALGTNKLTGTIPAAMANMPLLHDLGIDTNPLLGGHLPPFNFSAFTSCCALYNVPFECPLPSGADKCNHCNYHPVDAPSCN